MPAKSRFPGLHERNHFELSSQEPGETGQQRQAGQPGNRTAEAAEAARLRGKPSKRSTGGQRNIHHRPGFCRLHKKRQRRKTFAKQRTRQSVNEVAREPGSGLDAVAELRRLSRNGNGALHSCGTSTVRCANAWDIRIIHLYFRVIVGVSRVMGVVVSRCVWGQRGKG